MLVGVEVMDEYTIGSLDIVGMFPNIPVKKTLELVRTEGRQIKVENGLGN